MFRAYGGMAEAATVQWLKHGRLDRDQVAELLNRTALSFAGEILEGVRNPNRADKGATR